MLKPHCFGQYEEFPSQVNAVVEIPRTPAMHTKYEVDFSNGNILFDQKVDNPIPTYWHYGAIPQTLSDDQEPADVLIFAKPEDHQDAGSQIAVRPIGIFHVSDGWELYDHKIVAVPATQEYAHITNVSQLPTIPNRKKHTPSQLVDDFFSQYRIGDKNLIKSGWGDQQSAEAYLNATHLRYLKTPKSIHNERDDINQFDFSNRVFITPPPPASYDADTGTGDRLISAGSRIAEDNEYGLIYDRNSVRAAVKAQHINRSREELSGLNREALIQEKLTLGTVLKEAGAKAYTISNDAEWVRRAEAAGIHATFVDDPEHVVEHVEGLSGQTWEFLHFKKGTTNIVIAPSSLTERSLRTRLTNLGKINADEKIVVLHPPSELIPYPVPNSQERTVTQLSDWLDFGFGILPDQQNKPHLFISESVRRIAEATGKSEALQKFVSECRKYFPTVDFIGCTNKYGGATNFIDTGSAIIAPNCISDDGKQLVEERLGRALLRTPCAEHVHIGQPGPRCASFPITEVTYHLLRDKGLLQISGAHTVDDLHDPENPAYYELLKHTKLTGNSRM